MVFIDLPITQVTPFDYLYSLIFGAKRYFLENAIPKSHPCMLVHV